MTLEDLRSKRVERCEGAKRARLRDGAARRVDRGGAHGVTRVHIERPPAVPSGRGAIEVSGDAVAGRVHGDAHDLAADHPDPNAARRLDAAGAAGRRDRDPGERRDRFGARRRAVACAAAASAGADHAQCKRGRGCKPAPTASETEVSWRFPPTSVLDAVASETNWSSILPTALNTFVHCAFPAARCCERSTSCRRQTSWAAAAHRPEQVKEQAGGLRGNRPLTGSLLIR